MFEKVKKRKPYTDFPEPPSVLASMFYDIELHNDFAIAWFQEHQPKKMF
jgi:hypothetical protein